MFSNFRDLHSFPTRRSSDLLGFADSLGTNDHFIPVGKPAPPRPRRLEIFTSLMMASDRKSTRSELQSQFHIVCRLLLEKKNQLDGMVYNVEKLMKENADKI